FSGDSRTSSFAAPLPITLLHPAAPCAAVDFKIHYDRCMHELSTAARVLSFEDARHTVEQEAGLVRPVGTESIDLLSAAGRVLAEAITAERHPPPSPRSTRDGYAVRSADVAHVPAMLDVIAEIKAGEKTANLPENIGM